MNTKHTSTIHKLGIMTLLLALALPAAGRAATVGAVKEGWQRSVCGTYVPQSSTDTFIQGDVAKWYIGDTASECGPSGNRAEIVCNGSEKFLRLTTVNNNLGCAENLWAAPISGPTIQITPSTTLAISETGSLPSPQWNGRFPTCCPPPDDCVFLKISDARGNMLVYIFQRSPEYYPHTTEFDAQLPGGGVGKIGYHEIFIGAWNAPGGTYTRNLYNDFLQVPRFNAAGARVGELVFEITCVGVATIDDLQLGVIPPPPAPALAITSGPPDQAKLTNAVVVFQGTAKNGSGLLTPQYRLSNAAGTSSWIPALGASQWSVTVSNLVAGPNTLTFRVQDSAGNYSPEIKRTCTLLAPLVLNVTGCGTVSVGGKALSQAGANYFELGKKLSVEAKPCAGYLFSDWTGDLVTNSAKISLVMPSNLAVQANFVTNRFMAAKGGFNGLLYETEQVRHDCSGLVTLTLTDQGGYSGSVQVGGQRTSLSGKFNLQGQATNFLAGAKPGPLELGFSLEGSDRVSGSVRGTLSNQVWTADFIALRAVFEAKKRPAPYAGKYTLVVAGTKGSPTLPEGAGYGTVTLSTAGLVTFSGVLADGAKVSQSVPVSAEGLWPLYVALYNGKGSVLGWVGFTNAVGLGGDLAWTKPPLKTAYYPAGFAWKSEALGSSYLPPGKGLNAWGSTNARLVLTLEGGNLVAPLTNGFTLDAKNQVRQAELTNKLTLSFTPASGLFSGSQVVPGTGKAVKFNGVILQNATNAQGFFPGTNQSGRVSIRLP